MAENLAIEQAILRSPKLRGMKWKVPLLLGILFAVIFTVSFNPTIEFSSNSNAAQTFDFPWLAGIGAVLGFCFGFGIGCLRQNSWRSKILSGVRQQTRTLHWKMGVQRTFSWNTGSLTVSSAMLQTQIDWRLIDKLENGKIGIYGLSGEQIIFAFPKEALPPNLTAEELIKSWQSYCSKQPKLA